MRIMSIRTLLYPWLGIALSALAQLEPGKAPPAPELAPGDVRPMVDAKEAQKRIKDLGDGNYELGGIEFNSKTRRLRVPCLLNMRKGPIEFMLVHENGKTHESLLRTKVSALDLQVAMLLLNYEPGHNGLFDHLEKLEPQAYKNLVSTKTNTPGANIVTMALEWKTGQPAQDVAAALLKTADQQPPKDCGSWIFTGSMVQESGFSAALHGNFVSLYYDATGMFATPSKDNRADDAWEPNEKALPKEETDKTGTIVDTPVTLLIGPGQ
jgi:hypothetical protein